MESAESNWLHIFADIIITRQIIRDTLDLYFLHWHWIIIGTVIFSRHSHFASLVASPISLAWWSWSLIRFTSSAWMNWNCFAAERQLRASLSLGPSPPPQPPTPQIPRRVLWMDCVKGGEPSSVLLTSILIALRKFCVLDKTSCEAGEGKMGENIVFPCRGGGGRDTDSDAFHKPCCYCLLICNMQFITPAGHESHLVDLNRQLQPCIPYWEKTEHQFQSHALFSFIKLHLIKTSVQLGTLN